MDAKSRMNFINSVANEGKIPCPMCGTLNASGVGVCSVCGASLSPSAAPVSQSAPDAESASVFALGLPSWDLTPPQVAIWRKKK